MSLVGGRQLTTLAEAISGMREGARSIAQTLELVAHEVDPALLHSEQRLLATATSFDSLSVALRELAERPDVLDIHRPILRQATESMDGALDLVGRLALPTPTEHARNLGGLRGHVARIDKQLAQLSLPVSPKFVLTGRHARTLEMLTSANPPRMPWRDIESLLNHIGARIEERKGSAISVQLDGVVTSFHRPHPSPDAPTYNMAKVKRFLTAVGVI